MAVEMSAVVCQLGPLPCGKYLGALECVWRWLAEDAELVVLQLSVRVKALSDIVWVGLERRQEYASVAGEQIVEYRPDAVRAQVEESLSGHAHDVVAREAPLEAGLKARPQP